jgi:hypothetical protein
MTTCQTPSRDPVIEALVTKKRTLLSGLLRQSIQILIDPPDRDMKLALRQKTLAQLENTDRSIAIREKEVGIKAVCQEAVQYRTMKQILEAIRDNNSEAMIRLEQERKRLEADRHQLEKGYKLSDYIRQQNRYRTFGTQRTTHPMDETSRQVVKGTV